VFAWIYPPSGSHVQIWSHISGFVFSSFLCIFFSPTKEKEKNEFGFSVEEEEVRTGGGGV
jgi:membrane associated rhomboid family serine protease